MLALFYLGYMPGPKKHSHYSHSVSGVEEDLGDKKPVPAGGRGSGISADANIGGVLSEVWGLMEVKPPLEESLQQTVLTVCIIGGSK